LASRLAVQEAMDPGKSLVLGLSVSENARIYGGSV
jgi:hypothetical protein